MGIRRLIRNFRDAEAMNSSSANYLYPKRYFQA